MAGQLGPAESRWHNRVQPFLHVLQTFHDTALVSPRRLRPSNHIPETAWCKYVELMDMCHAIRGIHSMGTA